MGYCLVLNQAQRGVIKVELGWSDEATGVVTWACAAEKGACCGDGEKIPRVGCRY